MKFSSRVVRIATVARALYLTVALTAFALTAFALHPHAPREIGDPACALCIGHNITGAVVSVVAFALATSTLCWRLQLWMARSKSVFVASIDRDLDSRGPPAKVFLFHPISFNRKHFPCKSIKFTKPSH